MAPKRKRSHSSESTANKVVTRSSGLLSGIKTRSSTRSKTPSKSPAKPPAKSSASKAKSSAKSPAKSPAKAPAKSQVPEKSPEAVAKTPPPPPPAASVSPPLLYKPKNIVIEHCLENDLFESRATELKAALKKYAGVVNVVINPKTPRKGCLEVRDQGGEIYYSLMDLKTPYAELSEMDMSEVVSDIAVKILSED